jgi:hypothetical protein
MKNKPVHRFRFKWSESDDRVSAIVTMDTWFDGRQPGITRPDSTRKFELHADQNLVGMRGIGGGYIPKTDEKTREWLHLAARTYYHARHGGNQPFIWVGLD